MKLMKRVKSGISECVISLVKHPINSQFIEYEIHLEECGHAIVIVADSLDDAERRFDAFERAFEK